MSLGISIVSHRSCDSYASIGSLTYIKHQPPCGPRALSHVNSSSILGIGNQSEDFGGETDRVAVFVFGFEGFAAGFDYRMAATQVSLQNRRDVWGKDTLFGRRDQDLLSGTYLGLDCLVME